VPSITISVIAFMILFCGKTENEHHIMEEVPFRVAEGRQSGEPKSKVVIADSCDLSM
jgi:hypothetical protein